jgi:hypothetical protein
MNKHCTVQLDNCETWNYKDGFSLGTVLLKPFNSTRFWWKEKGNRRFLSAHRLKTECSFSHGNTSVTLLTLFSDSNSVMPEHFTLISAKSRTVMNEANKQRYCRPVAKSVNEITTWNNKIQTELHLTEQMSVIYKQSVKSRDSRNSCHCLQYIFQKIIENLKLRKLGRDVAISLLKGIFPRKFFNTNIILTNWKWVKKHKTLPQIRTLIRLWWYNK